MEVGSAGSVSSPANEAQVKVFNSAKNQEKAVAATILQGVEQSAPRAPEQSGGRLNVAA